MQTQTRFGRNSPIFTVLEDCMMADSPKSVRGLVIGAGYDESNLVPDVLSAVRDPDFPRQGYARSWEHIELDRLSREVATDHEIHIVDQGQKPLESALQERALLVRGSIDGFPLEYLRRFSSYPNSHTLDEADIEFRSGHPMVKKGSDGEHITYDVMYVDGVGVHPDNTHQLDVMDIDPDELGGFDVITLNWVAQYVDRERLWDLADIVFRLLNPGGYVGTSNQWSGLTFHDNLKHSGLTVRWDSGRIIVDDHPIYDECDLVVYHLAVFQKQ
tara:strand:- start:626 stop:1441 length:816 start_codon:yes stop_codon:yes gene_type:complete